MMRVAVDDNAPPGPCWTRWWNDLGQEIIPLAMTAEVIDLDTGLEIDCREADDIKGEYVVRHRHPGAGLLGNENSPFVDVTKKARLKITPVNSSVAGPGGWEPVLNPQIVVLEK